MVWVFDDAGCFCGAAPPMVNFDIGEVSTPDGPVHDIVAKLLG